MPKKIKNFSNMTMAERMAKVRNFKKKKMGGARRKMRGGGILGDIWNKGKSLASDLVSGINTGLKKTGIISNTIDTVAETLPFGLSTAAKYLNNKYVKSRGYGIKRRILIK